MDKVYYECDYKKNKKCKKTMCKHTRLGGRCHLTLDKEFALNPNEPLTATYEPYAK